MNLEKIKKEILESQMTTFAQLRQDIAALLISNCKLGGFFVEFGACDGLHLSNTFILEKEYRWHGILSEPSAKFNQQLKKNRTAIIDTRAVFSDSGEILNFKETNSQLDLSGLESFFGKDKHSKKREIGTVYEVLTVSLLDLLLEHSAPYEIDFLSIDTEGTEFDIIKKFDFTKYQINFITIEHNFIKETRENIRLFLESHQYTRIFTDISQWDDWYILNKCKDQL